MSSPVVTVCKPEQNGGGAVGCCSPLRHGFRDEACIWGIWNNGVRRARTHCRPSKPQAVQAESRVRQRTEVRLPGSAIDSPGGRGHRGGAHLDLEANPEALCSPVRRQK